MLDTRSTWIIVWIWRISNFKCGGNYIELHGEEICRMLFHSYVIVDAFTLRQGNTFRIGKNRKGTGSEFLLFLANDQWTHKCRRISSKARKLPVFGYCGSLSLGWTALYKEKLKSSNVEASTSYDWPVLHLSECMDQHGSRSWKGVLSYCIRYLLIINNPNIKPNLSSPLLIFV